MEMQKPHWSIIYQDGDGKHKVIGHFATWDIARKWKYDHKIEGTILSFGELESPNDPKHVYLPFANAYRRSVEGEDK
jgi:hypothetical protein